MVMIFLHSGIVVSDKSEIYMNEIETIKFLYLKKWHFVNYEFYVLKKYNKHIKLVISLEIIQDKTEVFRRGGLKFKEKC